MIWAAARILWPDFQYISCLSSISASSRGRKSIGMAIVPRSFNFCGRLRLISGSQPLYGLLTMIIALSFGFRPSSISLPLFCAAL